MPHPKTFFEDTSLEVYSHSDQSGAYPFSDLKEMLSPTQDFKIFLSKISGKTPGELLSAADEEIDGLFASAKKRSVSFAYLRDLLLLSSYIRVPPQKQDWRGAVPEQFKQTLRDLGLIPKWNYKVISKTATPHP